MTLYKESFPLAYVRLLVTFMEQRQAPDGAALHAPIAGLEIAAERLSVPDYLSLYRAIGEPVQWDDRLRMPQSEIQSLLESDSMCIYVLCFRGVKIGLFEAIRHSGQDFEIANFGLVRSAQGKGVGSYFLDFVLRSLWRLQPNRIWLHTDTNDHPAAVKTYERAGFHVFDRRWMDFPD